MINTENPLYRALITFVLYCILIFASAIVVNVARYLVEPLRMYHARRHIIDSAGGVSTLIALHHGRKTKSESFASCRGRVNIFGGSEIALLNEECNGDSVSVAVHSKVKKCLRNKALLLFLCDKFVVRNQLKRFRMNPNCSLAQESIHLVTVTLKSDGCVNDIKFASYLTGSRPSTCKRITKRQRHSDVRFIFHVIDFKA